MTSPICWLLELRLFWGDCSKLLEPVFHPQAADVIEVANVSRDKDQAVSFGGAAMSLRTLVSNKYMAQSKAGEGGPGRTWRSASISSKVLKTGASLGMPLGLKKPPSGSRWSQRGAIAFFGQTAATASPLDLMGWFPLITSPFVSSPARRAWI